MQGVQFIYKRFGVIVSFFFHIAIYVNLILLLPFIWPMNLVWWFYYGQFHGEELKKVELVTWFFKTSNLLVSTSEHSSHRLIHSRQWYWEKIFTRYCHKEGLIRISFQSSTVQSWYHCIRRKLKHHSTITITLIILK